MKKFKKIWRKLTIEDKTDILISKFDINKSDIDRIRKLNDGKRRLLEAAKLQFELFSNMHTDLTAWIAGYKSDAAVRNKFGSSLALRENFITPKIYPSIIKPSQADVRRSITIPNKATPELAEEIGIHIGDGCLTKIADKKYKWFYYRYRITGNLNDEYTYHKDFIFPLLKNLYNCPPVFTVNKNKNSIQTIINSKAVFEFKNKILNLPNGSKENILIPSVVLKNKYFIKRCVVGIIDTDFTISHNLCLHGSLTGLNIVKQLQNIFDNMGVEYSLNIRNNTGYFRIRKWSSIKIIKDWKLHNSKHLSKYFLYLRYKKILPFTRTSERLAVLNDIIEFEELKRISEERKVKINAPDQNIPNTSISI